MSGRQDPNRMTTIELSKEEVYRRVKAIARTSMVDGEWQWGKQPYDRHNPAPAVSIRATLPNQNFNVPNSLYITARSNFGALQRGLARRAREDDKLAPSKWGKDRTVSDTEDPDPEDQVLALRVVSNRGKMPVRPSIRNWTDDDDSDDDDCQILEAHDARPIRFSFPVSTTPADSDDQVVETDPISVGGLHPTVLV